MKLSEILDAVKKMEKVSFEHSIKIAFLRNFTTQGIEPFLKFHLLDAGIKPVIYFGDHDVIEQEILNTESSLHRFQPDIIVLSQYFEDEDEISLNRFSDLIELLQQKSSAAIMVNTLTQSSEANDAIRRKADIQKGRIFLCDWESYLKELGAGESLDYRFWYMSKSPFKSAFLNLYAQDISQLAKNIKGKGKKCLVLDCDNTIWGGIVGEDGPEGLKLDPYNYPGNVYYNFQKKILNLQRKGALLALNSKNNPEDVWQVLDQHPHCLLKRENFVSEKINWQDKATNLKSIAQDLNIGLESFVFVDDNPAECEMVRSQLPMVTVLQVPTEIYKLPLILEKSRVFEYSVVTAEDKKRTEMYSDDKKRNQEKEKALGQNLNLDEYLANLRMVANIHQMLESEVPRVAQLTQKTNQFNLTTRRYTEGQIKHLGQDSQSLVMTMSVADRFGELGLTAVMIMRRQEANIYVDTLLMSCRILGRGLEDLFVMHALNEAVKRWNAKAATAEFLPTKKNEQVTDFWKKMGFSKIEELDGAKKYSLDLKSWKPKYPEFIEVRK